jgi:hypothetical protein
MERGAAREGWDRRWVRGVHGSYIDASGALRNSGSVAAEKAALL